MKKEQFTYFEQRMNIPFSIKDWIEKKRLKAKENDVYKGMVFLFEVMRCWQQPCIENEIKLLFIIENSLTIVNIF